SEEGEYLKTYISNSVEKIFLNEYSDFAAKESPKTLAVSVYKPKLKRPPLIITINTSYYCCTPQLEGNLYKVNIYQINEKMKLTELTSLLGDKSEGFEGKAEGQVYYRFKNIYSIKKWLDKNYK
ncbi:MAG: hypothetical protein LBQ29_11200, partial [Acinetobacter sp.]|uniref:hypothetical protein n=1 Tax=Acinetobacter sp. TaxID=472 RepID=UPI002816A997